MIYLISLIIVLLPTYLIRFSVFGIPSTVLEVLIYAVTLYGIYQARKVGFRKPSWRIWLSVALLIIAAVISTIISPLKHEALGELKAFFIDPLMVAWLIFQFFKKEPFDSAQGRDFFKIVWAFGITGLVVAAHAIYQRFTGHLTPDGRVIGIFGFSPNYLALFLAPITVLVATQSLRFQSKKKHLISSILPEIVFIILLFGIYVSGSRGGLLAVAAGLGAFVIFRYWGWIRQRFSAQVIIAILILAAIYTSWTFFKPNFDVSPATGGRVSTSNNVRWQIWQTTLELGAKHPLLGVGLANYQKSFGELTKDRANFPEYITPMALTPHNIFLMFWLSTGLLGILGFLGMLVSFFRAAIWKKSEYTSYLMAVMVSILIYGLIDTPYWKNDLSVIFWTIWGLMIAI